MPTYEYLCCECKHRFEQFQGINDAPLERCSQCGGVLKRIISGGTGFLMKDSGAGSNTIPCGNNTPCCGRNSPCGNAGECG